MLPFTLLAACFVAEPAAEPLLPPPRQGGVYVVAHRGAHDGVPENTLAAYRRAIELGVDFVEIDLRTTRDGEIVSVHNATVDAYTKSATGPVKDFTLAELRALDIGSRIAPEWKNERIPTLREILTLCRGRCGIYLDLKDAPLAEVVKQVRAFEMERRCVWYGWLDQLAAVRTLCPECRIMPDPGPAIVLGPLLEQQQPRVVASSARFCTADFVARCHRAGALVVVDDQTPEDWPRFLEWGVDGIQTDRPAQLIELLKQRDKPKPQ